MDVVVNFDCQFSPDPQCIINGQFHYYQALFKCLGYSDGQLPVAELLRSYHGLKGQWFVVTPVHWQATHNDAMLLSCDSALNLNEDEARHFFGLFSRFAAEEGMQTYYHDAYTWMLQCDGKPMITASPPYQMLHQSLFPYLKSIDSTLFWQRFITEIQMLFHDQPIVNGVWIWGQGTLCAPSDRLLLVSSKKTQAIARILSTHTDDFSNAKLNKNALLLFDSLSQDELLLLQTQLSRYSVNWYWNNIAYSSKPRSWFLRLIQREI